MDFFGPHLLAYFIATLHFFGTLSAIHAVLTVRTAQGSIAWALSLAVPWCQLRRANIIIDFFTQGLRERRIRVLDGVVKKGQQIKFMQAGTTHLIDRVGCFTPKIEQLEELGPVVEHDGSVRRPKAGALRSPPRLDRVGLLLSESLVCLQDAGRERPGPEQARGILLGRQREADALTSDGDG